MDRFTNHIMPQVPGCPKSVIKAEVLRAGIEFCTNSFIWQIDEEHEVLDGASTITLSVTSGASVTACQLSIDKQAFNEYTRSDETVTLDDARTSDVTFQTTAFLKPTRAATDLPDILYNDWSEAIESKAKAELMLMPGRKWTNPQIAMINQGKYRHGLGEAKIKARKTNNQSQLMVRQRSFV